LKSGAGARLWGLNTPLDSASDRNPLPTFDQRRYFFGRSLATAAAAKIKEKSK